MIFNSEKETLPQSKLERLQTENLCNMVKNIYEKVPFYQKKMDELGIKPKDINHISDISKLPFTTKTEMRDVYPFGLLAVDKKDIEEIHTSSGTTGKPVVDAYTKHDLDIWSEVMARTLAMGGADSNDMLQNAYGYGLFTGGLGVHYGARRLGASILPISGGNTKRQLSVLQDFGSTVLTCTPSYSLYLAEAGKEAGINFKNIPLKYGFLGAEPWSETMRREIEKKLHISAYDIYGLTEIIGPGVASECEEQNMLHINEDHFYPEIIDPQTGETLPEGEKGELVITTITKTGTPVLRYRTRDITFFKRGKCSCGRTLVKMSRLLGRTDDMLIIRGVNIFPSQIEEVLLKSEGIEPHYHIIVEREDQLDTIELQVEMAPSLFSDEIKNIEKFSNKIKEDIYSALGINVKVKMVEPKTIKRSEGKAKRVTDKRRI